MASYIMLLNWTEQGMAKIKASSKRLDAGRKAFKKLGCELKDVYLTMGPYDLVCVVEAPTPRQQPRRSYHLEQKVVCAR